MKRNILVVVCLAVSYFCFNTPPAQAQTTNLCPDGTYDMLSWMTLPPWLSGSLHMEGTANALYTTMAPGKFYWTKGANGFPWDIQLFDDQYIYLWITELNWTNPQSFKKFAYNTNMPLVPRCAQGGYPGSTITVPDTSYQTYTDCTHYTTQDLMKAVNQVWGPYTITLGGDLPSDLTVLVASYRYNCDGNYDNCGDKEEYYLAQPYGLVKWAHYTLAGGSYQMQQQTIFNQLMAGGTSPYFPCF